MSADAAADAAAAQTRPLGRVDTAIRDLNPGYFAFVMATGIVSTGTFLLGPSWLSRALLVVASAGLVVLSVALVIRLVKFRPNVAAQRSRLAGRRAGVGNHQYGTPILRHLRPLVPGSGGGAGTRLRNTTYGRHRYHTG